MTAVTRQIAISVAPPPSNEVEYYEPTVRTIIVSSTSEHRLLIEDISLRFSSDSAQTSLEVKQHCGWELNPGDVKDQQIHITPTPLYREGTNTFDVKVQFRTTSGGSVSGPQREVYSSTSFVIIREPSSAIGQVFISLKQPEDVQLGHLMARMARRAGLVPFLKAENQRLSEDIWKDTIEPALRSSQAAIVIWTARMDWGAQGVEREIAICRECGIPEALLLENGVSLPDLYTGTSIEFIRFDIDDPGKTFATASDALRRRLQGSQT